jgi:hypothetical protein
VDTGATGAAVFYLCLVALLGLMALKGSDAFPETWSLAERRAWVGMGFSASSSGLLQNFSAPSRSSRNRADPAIRVPARDLVSFIIVMAIAWGMAGHVLGRGAGPVEHDERDLRLRFQADRIGDWHSASPWWACAAADCRSGLRSRVVAATAGAGQCAHRRPDREDAGRTCALVALYARAR